MDGRPDGQPKPVQFFRCPSKSYHKLESRQRLVLWLPQLNVEGFNKSLIHYFSLSNNEKESSRSLMAPVPLSLWHVRERVVPVVGAGGVGSGDEADTGVKFVIANYK